MKIFRLVIALIFMLNVAKVFAADFSNTVNNFNWNYYETLNKEGNLLTGNRSKKITTAMSTTHRVERFDLP